MACWLATTVTPPLIAASSEHEVRFWGFRGRQTRPINCFCILVLLMYLAFAPNRTSFAFDSPDGAIQPVRHITTLPGNRFWYLSEPFNPYYPHTAFPRLTTPQWIGESGVRAAIFLTIDDLRSDRNSAVYEAFLRPILEELKSAQGKAAVTLMANSVAKNDPLVERWLKDGAAIGTHTVDHPCPLLRKSNFESAKSTYDRAIDEISEALGTQAPRAYRMPCCDSINSMSPRFFAQIFHATTPQGRFLEADSSIFHVATAADSEIAGDFAASGQGPLRLARYLPADRDFVNFVENYPYPWVVGWGCWEIPMTLPDDWVAFHFHNQPFVSESLEDMKFALDVAVRKQGVYVPTFHPGWWIRNDQVVELIRYASQKYGSEIRFLTLTEAVERLNTQLTKNVRLRNAAGSDQGVRLLDLNQDRFLDLVISNESLQITRMWDSSRHIWNETAFPVPLVVNANHDQTIPTGVQFGVWGSDGKPCVLLRNEQAAGLWVFDGTTWQNVPNGLDGLRFPGDGNAVFTSRQGADQGVRLLDVNGDGSCELLVANPAQRGVFAWDNDHWRLTELEIPAPAAFVDAQGRDAGLRFALLNDDDFPDIVFSGASQSFVALADASGRGWKVVMPSPCCGERPELPPFVRPDGTQNGAWIRGYRLILQNEETGGSHPNHILVHELPRG